MVTLEHGVRTRSRFLLAETERCLDLAMPCVDISQAYSGLCKAAV
jgi:hypothetical protein